ncbi:DsrE family protein [Aneurinibacillus migulanus]|uniref:DsrE/DsrF-like family protein n=1 Tax=Aneurinibacillus migulanus TaxID=47500 RepID=A0A0D1VZZ1_ANEMI|nr:DsrE family protein [Aneurinibacillus migulanus]KIV51790.1 hypothetical protein TS65_24745 [Aneurinibacillus migulanus]KON97909.1 hypothetical protein AF333_23225 [Aneurinibacillus migulanus]MED0891151.1 DsrE family protein [Aneurinibacillus migulanus]MED1614161.1 DsrE family protein [Aneurinibacillus migulanus]SDH98008.1 DsrE/DsrF-like family protein [Aneurinibacillus migulanus]
MHIGIMITAAPGSASLFTAERLIRAVLARQWNISLFFMDNGVQAMNRFLPLLTDGQPPSSENRLQCIVCAHNCEERGIQISSEIKAGSQADWARIVNEAERVMVFG